MKITVAGTGYVGLSIAVLLAQHNEVAAIDIIKEKVDMIEKKSPIADNEIQEYLSSKSLSLTATDNAEEAYKNADFVVIAARTNYDPQQNHFDTTAVEAVIELVLKYNPNAFMVIKSTIPVGYTEQVRKQYKTIKYLLVRSLGRAKHCMTIYIPAELLWGLIIMIKIVLKPRIHLLNF